MENVAHALAGLLLAEGAVALRRRRGAAPSPRFGRLAYVASALANNVPDGDFVYSWITDGKLGYLLHHRGHTHTLPVGVALGLAVAAAVIAWGRRRQGGEGAGAEDARWLLGLGALGPVVHVTMDAWNVYGVHPFWPLHAGWFYGDAVFILEPFLWALGIPPILFAARSRVLRALLGLILAAGLALPWALPAYAPVPVRLALALAAALALAVAWRAGPGLRAAVGLVSFSAVAAVLFAGSGVARSAFEERLEAAFPDAEIHDLVLSALPANPLCFSAIAVQTTPGGELVLRRATVATLPSLMPAAACPRPNGEGTAPLGAVGAPDDARVSFSGEFRAPVARLRELARRCDVAALMRFLRAPFWVERPGSVIVGDLRYDRAPELDFAELELPNESGPCPRFVPPWKPPRQDLLGPER